jgi:hypothetical protein
MSERVSGVVYIHMYVVQILLKGVFSLLSICIGYTGLHSTGKMCTFKYVYLLDVEVNITSQYLCNRHVNFMFPILTRVKILNTSINKMLLLNPNRTLFRMIEKIILFLYYYRRKRTFQYWASTNNWNIQKLKKRRELLKGMKRAHYSKIPWFWLCRVLWMGVNM